MLEENVALDKVLEALDAPSGVFVSGYTYSQALASTIAVLFRRPTKDLIQFFQREPLRLWQE